MLTPDQFRVNEAWIVVRANESFLFVKDAPYDMYVLMDAASCYVLGHVLSRVTDEAPDEKHVEALFKEAWEAKEQWAEKLILMENSIAEEVFRKHAEKNNISVSEVPLSELESIVAPLKESFEATFMGDPAKIPCTQCGEEASTYDGVYLTSGQTSRFHCSKCYNELISEEFELDFEHVSFHPVNLEDSDDVDHTFHFQTRLFGDKVNIQALEIQEGAPKGYEYSVHGDAEDDLFDLFAKLVARIRRELGRKHIEPDERINRYNITREAVVRARITWDDDTDGEVPCLVIDGKELSWHEFGKMVMTYEGFHFKLEIFESSEER